MEQLEQVTSAFRAAQPVTENLFSNELHIGNQDFRFDTKARPTVSVIIPTLNEARNLPLVLPFLPMDWIDEVLLVDGRSTDNTVEVAQQLLPSIKVVLEKRRGKGAAMKAGYQAAQGDILIVVDADGSNDPREIPRYVLALMQGADMAKGSRFAHGGGTTDMPLIRRMGNGFFVQSVNLLFGCVWTDLCYGYHAFWRYCLDWFDLSDVDGFEIDTALYLRAASRQLHVIEVPSFEGYRFYGEGKLQTIPDGWRVLKTIAREWAATQRGETKERYLGFRGTPSLPNTSRDAQFGYQLLSAISFLLSSGVDLNDMLTRILEQSLKAMNAVSGSLLILDEKGDIFDGRMSFNGQVQGLRQEEMADVIQQGVVGWVLKHREPAVVANTHEDPRWLCRSWESSDMARSALVIPVTAGALTDGKNRVGVLTLVRPQVKPFTSEDLKTLEAISFTI